MMAFVSRAGIDFTVIAQELLSRDRLVEKVSLNKGGEIYFLIRLQTCTVEDKTINFHSQLEALLSSL